MIQSSKKNMYVKLEDKDDIQGNQAQKERAYIVWVINKLKKLEGKDKLTFKKLCSLSKENFSALWWLARGVGYEYADAFTWIWDKFKDQIPTEMWLSETWWQLCDSVVANNKNADILKTVLLHYKSKITLVWLLKDASNPECKGLFVLRRLAYLAVIGKPEAFELCWGAFKDKIPLGVFLIEPQLSNKKWPSLLWFFSKYAMQGNVEPLGFVFNKFQNEIPFDAWSSYGEINSLQILLWLLALDARQGKPEGFLSFWQKHCKKISPKLLLKGHLDKTALDFLISALIGGHLNKSTFLSIWHEIAKEITLEILLKRNRTGRWKGRSLLWWCALLESMGIPEPLEEMWEKYKNEITLEALLAPAEGGSSQGKSVLWFLAGQAFRGDTEVFEFIFNKFKEKIPLEFWLEAPQIGQSKDWSFFLHLANKMPVAFQSVFELHKNNIAPEVIVHVEKIANLDNSILWQMVCHAMSGQPQAFDSFWNMHGQAVPPARTWNILCHLMAIVNSQTKKDFLRIWDRVKSSITLEMLLQFPPEGKWGGRSLLWWGALLTNLDVPEVFLYFWEKYQNKIPFEALYIKAQDGNSKGVSALSWLKKAYNKGKIGSYESVMDKFEDRVRSGISRIRM